MKKLILIFALLPLFLFSNCSDSEDNIINITEPSDTEIVAKKLQDIIEKQNIQMATVYIFNLQENRWESNISCDGFKVDNPFIYVCGYYYHLSNLVQFRNNGSTLELYFKINN